MILNTIQTNHTLLSVGLKVRVILQVNGADHTLTIAARNCICTITGGVFTCLISVMNQDVLRIINPIDALTDVAYNKPVHSDKHYKERRLNQVYR